MLASQVTYVSSAYDSVGDVDNIDVIETKIDDVTILDTEESIIPDISEVDVSNEDIDDIVLDSNVDDYRKLNVQSL